MNTTPKYLFALIGHPLNHSLSPSLHAAALQFAGLDGEYQLIDIEPARLKEELAQKLSIGLNGFNVTIPYKQDIYSLTSKHSAEAKLIGAVNTVKVEINGELSGHNTDLIGFKIAFTEAFNLDLKNKTVLVIGAGGAAKAAVIALAQMEVAQIFIKGRNIDKINAFIEDMQAKIAQLNNTNSTAISPLDSQKDLASIALIVNASPIGLHKATPPNWCQDLLKELNKKCLCFDMVYNKDGSIPPFAQLAITQNLKTIDGLPMLIHQARFAFEYWTGINVPSQVMRNALSF